MLPSLNHLWVSDDNVIAFRQFLVPRCELNYTLQAETAKRIAWQIRSLNYMTIVVTATNINSLHLVVVHAHAAFRLSIHKQMHGLTDAAACGLPDNNSRFAHGVISDPTVSNATIPPVLNNTVPNGLMTL